MRKLRTLLWAFVLGAVLVPVVGASSALAGGGCHSPATEASESVVTIDGACFTATITRVPVGAKVTWTNKDPFAHVVVGQGYRWGSTQELLQGDRFSTVFRSAGIYPYTCYLHPGMNGAVVVGGVDAPKLDALGGDPASDTGISRDAPAPKTAANALSSQPAASRTSAGAWPATTAIGFALAFLLGVGLILQWRRGRAMPGAES